MITEADADTKALLPCPFCGGEGRVMLPTLPMVADCTDVVVYCVECNVCGPGILFDQTQQTASDLPDVEAEAIAAWNRRPALSMQSREAVPVAYRWRYVRALGPDKTWTVCQTPRQARPATADWAGIEVEPLYLHPASQADLREAGLSEAFTALDLADALIERAYGMDVPSEWNHAYRRVAKARRLAAKVSPQ